MTTPEEALQGARAVFRGVITAVEPAESVWRSRSRWLWCAAKDWVGGPSPDACVLDAHFANGWKTYGFFASFEVHQVWKGDLSASVRVRSDPPGGGSCGVFWNVGDRWLVYAYGDDYLSTSGCTRSAHGSDIPAEAELLAAASEGEK